MEGLSRLKVISNHLLGNLSFPKDKSLDEYRLRGLAFNGETLHDYYYQVGLPFHKELRENFRTSKSMTHENSFNLSKSEKRELVISQLKDMCAKIKLDENDHFSNPLKTFVLAQVTLGFDMAFSIKMGVHVYLYLDSLKKLGTEKHLPFVTKGINFNEIGCFALTELGHGSNVAQLGTTAHYIHETREFIINTPDSLSAKWWIGGAAQTSTKSVVFAQLYVKGVYEGLNAFVVDIRDPKSFQPKEGVIIGDCGKKSENEGIDNGFIIFKNYKVPYDSLLDKFSHINSEGKFSSSIKKKEKRLSTMLGALFRGRSSVVNSSEGNLKNALTIGIRWSAIRKQFGPPNSAELSILDYQLTRMRLIPHLANLFATQAGIEIIALNYPEISKKSLEVTDSIEVTEFHAILSSIKATTSE